MITHFLYVQSSSAYGVMLCFICAAKCRSPGDSVICDRVLCRFPVQSQLAYSGSKLQLNSGKLTDLIRKSWISLLSLQPMQFIHISERAEANLPVFSRTAMLCLTTIFPSCPSWLVGYVFLSCVHFLPVTLRANRDYCTFRFCLNMQLGCGWNAQCDKKRVFNCLLSFFA